ncbi:hypothetical protein DKX38_023727 [Salix brachista]|uniref:Retrotransposon Copia-like N-terminal domain-containing protein n=1 Tax=Salix brachista TaxID=2182728 RepID=A0A5N5JJK5_9ROSI|nr:hypothetical protein DKX38_023727 [Salix brachista]
MGDEEQNTSAITRKEGGSSSGTHDANNPFFVHHSDHPGMVLVPKLLNGDNYTTWCRSIRLSLGAKNKLGFIEGTVKIPSASENPDQYSHWLQCNDMVLSWILNSVQPEIADSVIYSTTAHEIWEDLKERFSQSNAPRIFQLHREITSLTQGHMSVACYFTKIKGLWDELASYNDLPTCSCGAMKKHHEREERNGLLQFLMGLNESYSAVRGQILLMNPLPTLRRAYALVSQEEKQRELGSGRIIESGSVAMIVRSNQQPRLNNRFHQQPRLDNISVTEGKSGGNDAARIAEVKAWLTSQFDAAEIEVPDFQYTPCSIAHLFNSATVSQAKTQAASIVANDFRQKAVEHRPQGFVIGFYCLSTFDVDFMAVAARMREMLENVGLAQESLPSNVVSSAQVLEFVANLLNIKDTELSRWAVILAAELHFCSCLFDVRIQKWRNANSFLVATGDILL